MTQDNGHTAGQAYMAVASSANFEPEGYAGKLVEMSFLAERSVPAGAGLFEIRFIRTLAPEERSDLPSVLSKARPSAPTLLAELSAAVGYMRNAKIDLETGATKATAIRTIEGGIKRAEAALLQARASGSPSPAGGGDE